MTRPLYTLLLRLALPLIMVRLWLRSLREPGYRRHLGERFGRYRNPRRSVRPLIWLHVVSVGEARAAAPLVAELSREYPQHQLLLTCMTAAGRDTIEQVYGDAVQVAFLPYDLPGGVRRFLAQFQPQLGVLLETEIWPNLLAACREIRIPVVLANARLSEKSRDGYLRWERLLRPAFESLAAVGAQSAADAQRLVDVGAAQVEVCGNLKFDVALDAGQLEQGRGFAKALAGRPVAVFASTRDGEERLLLEALRDSGGDWLAVIVPRHPQRFDAVGSLVASIGAEPVRRSRGEVPGAADRMMLGDSLGEMAFYYGMADVAVIGGSFLPLGGQNLIEACAARVPVVFGPHMFNFAEAARLAVESGAALQAMDAREALRLVEDLLSDPARRERMSAAGQALCAAHRGATDKHMQLIRRTLTARLDLLLPGPLP